MLVYIFTAVSLWFLDAPWWAFVLFIVCDFVDDYIYERNTAESEDDDAEF